jgi:hypothetical protein
MAKSRLKRDAAGVGPGAAPEPDVNDPALHAEAAPRLEPAANDPGTRDASERAARQARIRERAYRRAEARGFAPGRELEDWLAAEAEDPDDDDTRASR